MKRKPLDRMDCSIAKALDIVGDPWTMLILRDALLGVKRFETFSTRLGIPRRDAVGPARPPVRPRRARTAAYQDRPERVEYVLTPKGRALRPVVVTLMQWGDQWVRDDDPPTTIVDTDTGAVVDPVLVDRRSGTPLDETTPASPGSGHDRPRSPDGRRALTGALRPCHSGFSVALRLGSRHRAHRVAVWMPRLSASGTRSRMMVSTTRGGAVR